MLFSASLRHVMHTSSHCSGSQLLLEPVSLNVLPPNGSLSAILAAMDPQLPQPPCDLASMAHRAFLVNLAFLESVSAETLRGAAAPPLLSAPDGRQPSDHAAPEQGGLCERSPLVEGCTPKACARAPVGSFPHSIAVAGGVVGDDERQLAGGRRATADPCDRRSQSRGHRVDSADEQSLPAGICVTGLRAGGDAAWMAALNAASPTFQRMGGTVVRTSFDYRGRGKSALHHAEFADPAVCVCVCGSLVKLQVPLRVPRPRTRSTSKATAACACTWRLRRSAGSLRLPGSFNIRLEVGGRKLGIHVAANLVVTSIAEGGAIAAFNRTHADQQVRVGDRFLRVNGVHVTDAEEFARAFPLRHVLSATLIRDGPGTVLG